MKETSPRILLPLLPILGLYGCDLAPQAEDIVSSGGVVNKGILAQAVATAYKAGTRDVVKRAYTTIDGTFSLDDVNFEGTLYVEVRTTSQTLATCDGAEGCGEFPGGLKLAGESDANLNGIIDFGDKYFYHDGEFVLTAYIIPSADGSKKFAVTPLTHMAAEAIKATGNVNADNVQNVNAQIAELLGLDGTDITRVIPPDITNEANMVAATPSQRLYAALNAAVASSATQSVSVAKVINDLAASFVGDGGLVANSSDSTKVTLASLQQKAKAVATVVSQKLTSVDMTSVTSQIDDEITEQLAQTPDAVVKPSTTPTLKPDFDKDGIADSDETALGTDPYDADSDDDGLKDGAEVAKGTNPLNADTDKDGMTDGWEVLFELNPLDPADAALDKDADGLTNLKEFEANTLPNTKDSDGDGLNDFVEINTHQTNPLSKDTDGDGLEDAAEINTHLTNPLLADSDSDGLNDFDEINTHSTDPNLADSDSDGMDDGWEVQYALNPLDATDASGDADGDEFSNLDEFNFNSDPTLLDTDGDGATDIEEYNYSMNPRLDDANTDTDNDTIKIIDEYRNGSDPLVPNPSIEFVSDADIYASGSSGNMALHIDGSALMLATWDDISDKTFSDGGVDPSSQQDIIEHNLNTDTYRIPIRQSSSGPTPGGALDAASTFLSATPDFGFSIFKSSSDNVVNGDSNALEDFFVQNRYSGAITILNSPVRFEPYYDSGSISANGNIIAFHSHATASTLDTGVTDNNGGLQDIYRYDRAANQLKLVSRPNGTNQTGNSDSLEETMSADGRFIAFRSNATDLGTATTAGVTELYLYDHTASAATKLKRVSVPVNAADEGTNSIFGRPVMSKNGKGLLYVTSRDMLDKGVPSYDQLYYYDIQTLQTFLVSKSWDASNAGYGDGFVDYMSMQISADGEYVVYKSSSENLAQEHNGPASIDDIYVWSRSTQTNRVMTQFVYGKTGTALNYDDNPNLHSNGMNISGFKITPDASAIYAILDYGDEYTDTTAACTGAFTYCIYRIKTFLPQTDSDNDGLNNRREAAMATNINVADSDGDGLKDGAEVLTHKTNPLKADSDGDGVNDGTEITNGTNPLNPSSF